VLLSFLRRLDYRHRAWRYRTRIDPAEIRWMRGALRPGDVVVDAGAYKGGYTHWMRREVEASGQVFAFEPQPELAAFLRRMSEDFSWTNVHVEEAALSSGPGERTLHAPGSGPSQRASLVVERADERRYGVRLRGLDEFLAGRPEARPVALIKCDVEGHELDVFRGAHNVLSRDRPRLLFECEARHDRSRSIHDVFTYLLELGYRGSFFWRGERRELGEFDVAMHQVPGRRHFANNFAFEAS
jgi:FkbM family methyltransferase